ncbi:DUF554 domain-containing protein [Papillibacter cinnamivorans]|uniref:DUF554 domain-containing protein n=1 Tax=Papillibacter cinnamivorans DSM 12816 TaxID=1122930 RepID=A0A1W1ZLQ7_9FIRM|nr:DUF554 domain-containing protein [Papillibacter cinnamivorans]SMC49028.1 hypothetical protein SAMN02745168_1203 [Papillibacter cinnamivorans DSM 12816]
MIATVINAVLVLAGSLIGILFKNRIHERFSSSLVMGLGLCVITIGIISAIRTENILTVIICMVLGTLIGEAARIEDRLDGIGEFLRSRLAGRGENSRFTEGFVTASVLFCVGSMAVMGSLEAGINHNYSIIISKGVIDGVTSITFAAAMGIGVAFSALPILIYQGALTLLAGWVGPLLSESVVTEMSAVGGAIIIGIGLNMLGIGKNRIRVGNMLPAIFLPIAYIPFASWLVSLF